MIHNTQDSKLGNSNIKYLGSRTYKMQGRARFFLDGQVTKAYMYQATYKQSSYSLNRRISANHMLIKSELDIIFSGHSAK